MSFRLPKTSSRRLRHVALLVSIGWGMLFLFLPAPVQSEDLTELYRNYIPSAILENHQYREMVSARLGGKALIHPELIYFNIQQLRNLYQDSNKISQSDFNEYLYRQDQYYVSKRSEWARNTLRKVRDHPSGKRVADAAESYLRAFIVDTVRAATGDESVLTVDNAMMDYFVVLYFQRDATLRYDPGEDYRARRLDIERSKLARFEEEYDAIVRSASIQSEALITALIREWYLHDEVTGGSPDAGEYHDAGDIIGTLLSHNYAMDRMSGFSVEVGYSAYNSMSTTANIFPVEYKYIPSYSDQPTDLASPEKELRHSVVQFITSLGYRVSLRDEVGIFSYLNVKVAASFSSGGADIAETEQRTYTQSSPDVDITVNETLEYRSTVQAFNSYTAVVGIPLLVIGRSVLLGATVHGGLLHVNTSTVYDYTMRKTEGYNTGPLGGGAYYSHTIAIGDGSGSTAVQKNSFLLYPTLDLTFVSDVGIQVSVSGNTRYLALVGGYRF